jgi:hypothetical protein
MKNVTLASNSSGRKIRGAVLSEKKSKLLEVWRNWWGGHLD